MPCEICTPPVIHICARPSQPLLPYFALQTSMRPAVGRQFLGLLTPPATIVVSNTFDWLQSADAPARYASQALVTLSRSFKVNGLLVRAQWYPPQEWFAYATDASAPTANRVIITANNLRRLSLVIWILYNIHDLIPRRHPPFYGHCPLGNPEMPGQKPNQGRVGLAVPGLRFELHCQQGPAGRALKDRDVVALGTGLDTNFDIHGHLIISKPRQEAGFCVAAMFRASRLHRLRHGTAGHRGAAHPAVLLVRRNLPDRGESDQDVDSPHDPDAQAAEDDHDQVPPTQADQEPVQAADHQQDEGDQMHSFHLLKNWNGFADLSIILIIPFPGHLWLPLYRPGFALGGLPGPRNGALGAGSCQA